MDWRSSPVRWPLRGVWGEELAAARDEAAAARIAAFSASLPGARAPPPHAVTFMDWQEFERGQSPGPVQTPRGASSKSVRFTPFLKGSSSMGSPLRNTLLLGDLIQEAPIVNPSAFLVAAGRASLPGLSVVKTGPGRIGGGPGYRMGAQMIR